MPNGKNFFRLLAVFALTACEAVSVAQAGDNDGDCDRPNLVDTAQLLQAESRFWQECATCHIGYSPGMLPTEAWRNIMGNLERHFGTDASLPAREIGEIIIFLADRSTDCWGAETVPLRITTTDWFQRRHNSYVIPPDIWNSRPVQSPANCPACHRGAGSGHYSAGTVRLPQ